MRRTQTGEIWKCISGSRLLLSLTATIFVFCRAARRLRALVFVFDARVTSSYYTYSSYPVLETNQKRDVRGEKRMWVREVLNVLLTCKTGEGGSYSVLGIPLRKLRRGMLKKRGPLPQFKHCSYQKRNVVVRTRKKDKKRLSRIARTVGTVSRRY